MNQLNDNNNRDPKKEAIYRTVSLGLGILIALFIMKYL